MPTQPTPFVAPADAPATGSAVVRALRALVVERRLPDRVKPFWDRVCRAVGSPRKTVRADGFHVRVRRGTCDEAFVENVLIRLEYTRSGYDIRPGQTVIDVGANIGTFTMLASRAAGNDGRVFAFEPNPENYALLLENLARNSCRNVTAERVAVAGKHGRIALHHGSEGGYHTLYADRLPSSHSRDEVDAVTLQGLLDGHGVAHCDLMKVDCEGAEYDIFYALPPDYWQRISKIVMEYHGIDPDPLQDRARADALVAYLEKNGFRIDAYEVFPSPFRGGHICAARSSKS